MPMPVADKQSKDVGENIDGEARERAGLAGLVNQIVAAELPASVQLTAHAAADGDGITLDAAVDACLRDAADPGAAAATLLQLNASLDDADLRIGLVGEYDQLHLYRMLPFAGLNAPTLIEAARALAIRAGGLHELVTAAPAGSRSPVPEGE